MEYNSLETRTQWHSKPNKYLCPCEPPRSLVTRPALPAQEMLQSYLLLRQSYTAYMKFLETNIDIPPGRFKLN